MDVKSDRKCIGTINPLLDVSISTDRSLLKFQSYVVMSKDFLYCRMPWAVPTIRSFMSKKESPMGVRPTQPSRTTMNLQAGDWIEVKSENEIRALLDKNGKTRGLRFMPEMWQFCGKRYRVFKKLERIKIEETGEMRTIKSPTFFLDGVYCDGGSHDHCDRSCFLFWKEDWLKKATIPEDRSG